MTAQTPAEVAAAAARVAAEWTPDTIAEAKAYVLPLTVSQWRPVVDQIEALTPLEHALAYAARGWRVAPVKPGTKWPCIDSWQTVATTDTDQITVWWTQWPDYGVSIVTGTASGIFAVDVDQHLEHENGEDTLADLIAANTPLPDTVESITGAGGRHLVWRMPDGVVITNDAGKRLGPGLDVRGEGGQIVAAPTIHPTTGRAYEWEAEHDPFDGIAVADAPQWLIDLLLSEPPSQAQARRERTGDPTSDRPGDRFNARTTWPELLEADGWRLHSAARGAAGYELWTRPGKEVRDGASASVYYGGSDVLKVFSSNCAPLEQGRTYDRFGYLAATSYRGDIEAAAKALAAEESLAGREQIDLSRLRGSAPSPTVDDAPEPNGRRWIRTNDRHHDEIVDEAGAALVEHNAEAPTMFARGVPVRVRADEHGRPVIEELRLAHVRLGLARSARWTKTRGQSVVPTDPPDKVAESILARSDIGLPVLAGIVETPILRNDGSVRTEGGYDATTGLYRWGFDGRTSPNIELADAVALIDDLLADFPFDTPADRANAWGLLLTGIVRHLIDSPVPLALLDAPSPGTGKTLLAEIVAITLTGRPAPLAGLHRNEEELEKRITAQLFAGAQLVVWDNVEGIIRSEALARLLTSTTWEGRLLGSSKRLTLPARGTFVATGNNISVGGDLARRCYRIRLDAREAAPWERSGFRHADLRGHLVEHRHEVLAALTSMVASWIAAGRPEPLNVPPLGSFGAWRTMIGGVLEHAGISSFLDNAADLHGEADVDASEWETFLWAIWEEWGAAPFTVGEIIQRAADPGSLIREHLPAELADKWGAPSLGKHVGWRLRARDGRFHGASRAVVRKSGSDRSKVAKWVVTVARPQADDAQPPENPAKPDTPRQDAGLWGFEGSLQPHVRSEAAGDAHREGAENEPAKPHNPAHDDPGPADTSDEGPAWM